MDQNIGGSDTRDACRLIFMASLANVPNAVLGLSMPEIVAYLCAPGRNLAKKILSRYMISTASSSREPRVNR